MSYPLITFCAKRSESGLEIFLKLTNGGAVVSRGVERIFLKRVNPLAFALIYHEIPYNKGDINAKR